LAVDEKSGIRALDRTQPMLPLKPGHPKRHMATYRRLCTTCLLAVFSVHEGQVEGGAVGIALRIKSSWLFSSISIGSMRGGHLHVIIDNFAAHKHQQGKP
jgi:hypothetical protein